MLEYIKYCYNWYKSHGFKSKAKPTFFIGKASDQQPIVFKTFSVWIKERREIAHWASAGRECRELSKHKLFDVQSVERNAFLRKYNENSLRSK